MHFIILIHNANHSKLSLKLSMVYFIITIMPLPSSVMLLYDLYALNQSSIGNLL
jgi:hypothetical protein